MIRLQDNVPAYYVEQSRDFQLLCRLYDILISAEKNNVDATSTLVQPNNIKSILLSLLCSRCGFITSYYLDDDILRNIAAAFPFIVRKKGTLQGIALAVNTILKAEKDPSAVERVELAIDKTSHEITILTPITLYNKVALQELLRYVIPAGIYVNIQEYASADDAGNVNTTLYQKDIYDIISIKTLLSSNARTSTSKDSVGLSINTNPVGETVESRLINNIYTSQIVGSKDVEETE